MDTGQNHLGGCRGAPGAFLLMRSVLGSGARDDARTGETPAPPRGGRHGSQDDVQRRSRAVTGVVLALWLGLEIKHLAADYMLQWNWMLAAKTDLKRPGNYVHAGLHALFSVLVLAVVGVQVWLIAVLAVGEFVVHFALDYAKAALSQTVTLEERPRLYWMLHGIDQTLHRLTYVAMAALVVVATPAAG